MATLLSSCSPTPPSSSSPSCWTRCCHVSGPLCTMVVTLSLMVSVWSTTSKTASAILMGLFAVASMAYYRHDIKTWAIQRLSRSRMALRLLRVLTAPPPGIGFALNHSTRSASLTYVRNGQQYLLNIPYDRKLVVKMSRCRVTLLKDGHSIDITQQPGVPYMVTAAMLGGQSITVTRAERTWTFGLDEVPRVDMD